MGSLYALAVIARPRKEQAVARMVVVFILSSCSRVWTSVDECVADDPEGNPDDLNTLCLDETLVSLLLIGATHVPMLQ